MPGGVGGISMALPTLAFASLDNHTTRPVRVQHVVLTALLATDRQTYGHM